MKRRKSFHGNFRSKQKYYRGQGVTKQSFLTQVGVERTPNPIRTHQRIGAHTRLELPDPIKCRGPDIKVICSFHIQSAIFSKNAQALVCEF